MTQDLERADRRDKINEKLDSADKKQSLGPAPGARRGSTGASLHRDASRSGERPVEGNAARSDLTGGGGVQ